MANAEIWRAAAFDEAVTDTCAKFELSRPEFFASAMQWDEYRDRLWAVTDPDTFYLAWNGKVAKANVCMNIIDQFSRVSLWHYLYGIVEQMKRNPVTLLDYGCGTAVLSFPFLKDCARGILMDVPNAVQDFVRWRLQEHGLGHAAALRPEMIQELPSGAFNLVLCIDVLEHLPNPTGIFRELMRLTAPGGIFLLRAPWAREGEPLCEHLPEAPRDWFRSGGGAQLLDSAFTLLASLDHGGIYRKND